ncbi:helix-turn-helix domain-containing protein [Marinomonas algicola]|jgi:transcriptional regulator with XRE-family HTH domain|uniref:helix-turn-helix domain-containing protein n=1 Tax=Marinomonas algicola TaxID=2773454 RepID=UPI00174B6CA9|nr:helix-turn-helix transcriptional regulator [Marinomonas algicola]
MSKIAVIDIDAAIGRRIQLRRKELQMSAASLSEKVGLSQQQLSRYERGVHKINASQLFQIAVFLDSPISWFFLDCDISDASKIANKTAPYVAMQDADLQARLQQVWVTLSRDQQRKMIALLDAFSI